MSARAVIAKISCPDGKTFTTAISVQADGDPAATGWMLHHYYRLEADIDRLLAQGNLKTLGLPPGTPGSHLLPSIPEADPATSGYAQPGAVPQLLISEWLDAASPDWLYVIRWQPYWFAVPVGPSPIVAPVEDVIAEHKRTAVWCARQPDGAAKCWNQEELLATFLPPAQRP